MESALVEYKGDAGKMPMQERDAILLLLGLFLLAMTPLVLLPLFLRDSQGRRRVGWRVALSILAVGVIIIICVPAAMNWNVVAPYAEDILVGTQNVFNVATQLPGDVLEWFESGEGLRFFLKGIFISGFSTLLCAWLVPILQEGVRSLTARRTGTEITSEPQCVYKEDLAALWQRQEEELQEKAREKKEMLRQQQLMRITEQEQRFHRFGRGVGPGVAHYAR